MFVISIFSDYKIYYKYSNYVRGFFLIIKYFGIFILRYVLILLKI